MARGADQSVGQRLRGVETSPCHHRRPCRSVPVRGRPYLRGLPGLDQPPPGPLPRGGRGGLRTPFTRPEDQPRRHTVRDGRARRAAAQTARGVRSGRRRGHHRMASATSAQDHAVASHDQPDPGPLRRRHSRPVQAAQELLHPVRSRAAERNLAVRLHPLPTHQTRRSPRHRRRGHHLARRPLPLRPTDQRPRPRDQSDRAGHLPASR